MEPSKSSFKVGPWAIHPSLNRVRRDDQTERLEPKVMQVLLCLAERPGEAVTRDALLDTVWAETVVTDDVLTRSISELRKVFGDDARSPSFIETIPKTGYRLIAPVDFDYHGDTAPRVVPLADVEPPGMPQPSTMPAASGRRRWWYAAVATAVVVCFVAWQLVNSADTPPHTLPEPVPFTSFPGAESAPAFSPDGNQIAFTWNGGAGGANVDVYTKLVGTETPLRLTSASAFEGSPVWSPDGRRVAYQRFSAGGCDIMSVSALGGAPRRMAACGLSVYADLAWSPDGTWLAFSNRDSTAQPFAIMLLSLETGETRYVTHPPAGAWGDHDPAFSPDGRRLAFTRSASEGIQDLFVVSAAGGDARRLTFDSRNLKGHDWMRDGRHIVFASNRGGDFALWAVPASGGTPARLSASGWHAEKPVVAPDGHALAFSRVEANVDVWQVALGTAATQPASPLVASTRWDLHPRFSPDGRRVAFASNRSGSYEVWAAQADGSDPVMLTHFDGPFTGTPRWSPDGQRVVFDSRPNGNADVFVVDAEGGQPTRLTDDPADDLAATFSPGGEWIYFASARGGSWDVWRLPAAGGKAHRVTREGGFAPQVSPDGRWIYHTRHDTPGIWRSPVDGGTPERVVDDLRIEDWGSWRLTADGIFYVRRNPSRISFFDASTGTTRDLFRPPHDVPMLDPAFDVSPDATILLLGQTVSVSSDVMLVEHWE